jgi:hypothetical protein
MKRYDKFEGFGFKNTPPAEKCESPKGSTEIRCESCESMPHIRICESILTPSQEKPHFHVVEQAEEMTAKLEKVLAV